MIVGQLGGGLGSYGGPARRHRPTHTSAQTGDLADRRIPTTAIAAPTQGPRVQSFATEVAAGVTTNPALWAHAVGPGYVPACESGTHPSIQGPMGLYEILVVTTAPVDSAGVAVFPGVNYNADVPGAAERNRPGSEQRGSERCKHTRL